MRTTPWPRCPLAGGICKPIMQFAAMHSTTARRAAPGPGPLHAAAPAANTNHPELSWQLIISLLEHLEQPLLGCADHSVSRHPPLTDVNRRRCLLCDITAKYSVTPSLGVAPVWSHTPAPSVLTPATSHDLLSLPSTL